MIKDFVYEILKERAYLAYQRDWCRIRNYPLCAVQEAFYEEREYQNEMFDSLGDFAENDFQNEDYMRSLLGEKYDVYLSAMDTSSPKLINIDAIQILFEEYTPYEIAGVLNAEEREALINTVETTLDDNRATTLPACVYQIYEILTQQYC